VRNWQLYFWKVSPSVRKKENTQMRLVKIGFSDTCLSAHQYEDAIIEVHGAEFFLRS
jgi:hypothetical protein